MRLNQALPAAPVTANERGRAAHDATRCLAYLYQVAASTLVKLGDLDLARLCADRGDLAVQMANDPIASASLQRSVAHTLLSNAQYGDAIAVVVEVDLGDGRRQMGLRHKALLGRLTGLGGDLRPAPADVITHRRVRQLSRAVLATSRAITRRAV